MRFPEGSFPELSSFPRKRESIFADRR